ncbi:hypothetical protein QYF36_012557 [Acer negundo]|nr:hypothetical protein QYF36_012557 [Acer negundo]
MDSSPCSGHQPSLTESDTNVEPNITALLDLNDPCVLRGLKSSDMLGREFWSLNEAEVFYEKYAKYFRSRQNVQALDSTQDLQNGADASSHANITDSDWETALAYLSAKKEMDPGFYFKWRKNAKVVKSHDFSEAVPTEVTELVRFGSLMAQCSKLCYYASKTIVGYNEAKQALCSLTRRMEELMTMDLQSHNTTLVPSKRGAVVNDPHIAKTKGAQKSRKQCNATVTQGDRCMEIGHTNQTYEKTIPTSISAVSSNTLDVNCDSREYVPDRLPTIDKQCSVLVDFNVQVGGSMSCDSTVIAPTPQSFPFVICGTNGSACIRNLQLNEGRSLVFLVVATYSNLKHSGTNVKRIQIAIFGFGKLNDIFRIARILLAA